MWSSSSLSSWSLLCLRHLCAKLQTPPQIYNTPQRRDGLCSVCWRFGLQQFLWGLGDVIPVGFFYYLLVFRHLHLYTFNLFTKKNIDKFSFYYILIQMSVWIYCVLSITRSLSLSLEYLEYIFCYLSHLIDLLFVIFLYFR